VRQAEDEDDEPCDCATRGASEPSCAFIRAGRPQASILPFISLAFFSPRASDRPLGRSTEAEATEAKTRPKPTTTITNFFICIFLSALYSYSNNTCFYGLQTFGDY
jgi:hypothetical protein